MFPPDTQPSRDPEGSWLWQGSVGWGKSPSQDGEADEDVFVEARLGLPAGSHLPSTGPARKGSSCALRFLGGLFIFILK